LIRKFLLCLLVAPSLVYAAGQETAADDPWLLLEKAAEAAHKLNYKGLFVYQAGQNVNSFQIVHSNYGTSEYARVIELDGLPREVLRQGNEVIIYQPKSGKVMIEKRRVQSSFPAILPNLTSGLKASYQIKLEGQDRVGGRDAVIIHLDPRDKLRYGYKFMADREFGLLLKLMVLNEKGDLVEQIAFNQLALVNNADINWFHPNVKLDKTYVMQPEETVAPTKGDDWVIGELPAGFHKVEQVCRNVPGKIVKVNHLVFSDGLASVSLFIEPLDKSARPKSGYFVQGPTNVFASVVEGRQVIVVGEVPEATVRRVANSVSFRK